MRRLIIVLALAVLLLVPPGRAFAHGLGGSYDLPIPAWLYLFGAAAVVLVSFFQIGLLVGEGHALRRYPRFDLLRIGPLRALLSARPFLLGLRLLSVALFLLVILAGLFGEQDAGLNLAPTFVWIVWWVGFSFFTAFVGNLWPLVNPWKVLFEWAEAVARRLGLGKGLELREPYPASWGVWPAVVLYAAFVWAENVFAGSATPVYLATLALNYSVLAWGGMVFYGKETWLQRGEVFSVFFGLLARFAPTEVRVTDPEICRGCTGTCRPIEGECVDCHGCFGRAAPKGRELNLRPWAVGLARPETIPPGGVPFVILVLAAVAFDSLLETPQWGRLGYLAPSAPTNTLGLLALPLLFLAVYLSFVKLIQLFGSGYVPFGRLAAAYVYTLVPIAVVYQVAHYYTYLLTRGQATIALVSDPFGRGWDIFGTAGYKIDAGLVGADTVWYSQIVLIVAGHVIAVYLAHVASLRLVRDPRLAMRSQYPMLALMIIYTVFSLWILSQPIAE